MAANVDLTQHDIHVLEKIRDPDSNPAANLVVDERLPRDPNISDPDLYDQVATRERSIIKSIRDLEIELAASPSDRDADAVAGYKTAIASLDDLIRDYPKYASARNNRAQALRRLYGDSMLLSTPTASTSTSTSTASAAASMPLISAPARDEKRQAAARALEDLHMSIALLTPPSFSSPMAPTAARTLSSALTQRGALYLHTSKRLAASSTADGGSGVDLDLDDACRESKWTSFSFQEAASHDLALGGRYGNEIAKNLAVSVNPTAKLCGQIVREAMRKEYGPDFMPPESQEDE